MAGIKVLPNGEDECVLEMEVLWETDQEGVVIVVQCPGPNFKVQMCYTFPRITILNHCLISYNGDQRALGTLRLHKTPQNWVLK